MIIHQKFETIEITDIEEDVKWSDVTTDPQFSGGWHINFIQWVPGTADDVLMIQNGSGLSDPLIYYSWAQGANVDLPRYFYGAKVQFFIDYSQCTLSTGHKVLVQLMPIGGSFIR